MLIHRVFLLPAVLLALGIAGSVTAQPSLVPTDAKWGLMVDVNQLINSGLGRSLEARAAAEERQNVDAFIGRLSEMFGVDLREDVSTLAVFGTGFEPRDAAMVLGIGDAETNIEGMLLAARGYESYDYAGPGGEAAAGVQPVLIHSALPDEEDEAKGRYYVAVMPGEDGVAFASHDPRRVEAMVDAVRAGASLAPAAPEGDAFMRAYISELPREIVEGSGPQATIAAMVKGFELVGRSGETTSVSLTATMVDAGRARQIEQLLRSGIAMLELAAADDRKAAAALDLSDYLAITRPEGEATVTVDLSVETAELGRVLDLLKAME